MIYHKMTADFIARSELVAKKIDITFVLQLINNQDKINIMYLPKLKVYTVIEQGSLCDVVVYFVLGTHSFTLNFNIIIG